MLTKEMLDALSGLLSIESVAEDGQGDAPFGEGCKAALDYMLALCESFGFRTKHCGNLLGYAEIGEGDELIGILVHLGVVPAGGRCGVLWDIAGKRAALLRSFTGGLCLVGGGCGPGTFVSGENGAGRQNGLFF